MYHSPERRTCRSPKLKDSRNNIHVSSFCLFLERSWHQQKYRKRKRTPPVTRRHISPHPEKHGRRETRDRNKFSFFYYYYYYYLLLLHISRLVSSFSVFFSCVSKKQLAALSFPTGVEALVLSPDDRIRF